MNELRELYQEMIIDHGRRPRNFGHLEGATCCQEGFNPLCGDKLTLYLQMQDDKLQKLSFEGSGCAISMASASLMTEFLSGKTMSDANEIFILFHRLVTEGSITEVEAEKLGKLSILGGVFEFPARVKCATLAWHTLKAALAYEKGIVSTE